MAAEGRKPRQRQAPHPPPPLQCPRCGSTNTKFCYYNNYNTSQPRHYCRACERYWTHGGALRNVPPGGGGGGKKRAAKSRTADPNFPTPNSSKLPKLNIIADAAAAAAAMAPPPLPPPTPIFHGGIEGLALRPAAINPGEFFGGLRGFQPYSNSNMNFPHVPPHGAVLNVLGDRPLTPFLQATIATNLFVQPGTPRVFTTTTAAAAPTTTGGDGPGFWNSFFFPGVSSAASAEAAPLLPPPPPTTSTSSLTNP